MKWLLKKLIILAILSTLIGYKYKNNPVDSTYTDQTENVVASEAIDEAVFLAGK